VSPAGRDQRLSTTLESPRAPHLTSAGAHAAETLPLLVCLDRRPLHPTALENARRAPWPLAPLLLLRRVPIVEPRFRGVRV